MTMSSIRQPGAEQIDDLPANLWVADGDVPARQITVRNKVAGHPERGVVRLQDYQQTAGANHPHHLREHGVRFGDVLQDPLDPRGSKDARRERQPGTVPLHHRLPSSSRPRECPEAQVETDRRQPRRGQSAQVMTDPATHIEDGLPRRASHRRGHDVRLQRRQVHVGVVEVAEQGRGVAARIQIREGAWRLRRWAQAVDPTIRFPVVTTPGPPAVSATDSRTKNCPVELSDGVPDPAAGSRRDSAPAQWR